MTQGSWTYRSEKPCCELAALRVWSWLDRTLSMKGLDREMTEFISRSRLPQKRSSPGPVPSTDPWSIPTKSSCEQSPPVAPPKVTVKTTRIHFKISKIFSIIFDFSIEDQKWESINLPRRVWFPRLSSVDEKMTKHKNRINIVLFFFRFPINYSNLPSNGAPKLNELGNSVSHLMAQKFSSTRTQAVYLRFERYRDRLSI